MEASTGCRLENFGLYSIQLGRLERIHLTDAGRDAVLKLQRCRRTVEPIDLGVICIQMRAETMALDKSSTLAVYNRNRTDSLLYATQNQR